MVSATSYMDAELLMLEKLQFGLGARTCLGRHISMLEMSKLIPRLVREFDFEFVGDGEKDWTTVNTWFVKPKNFVVRIRRRI